MKLVEKQICTGCSACYSICPVNCISMKQDDEGFSFPIIDETKCIECRKCKDICLSIIQQNERKPLNVYAVKNIDEEIRQQSSSGGVFTLLAESIINEGGVVFGAKFNDTWEVVHDYTETIEGLSVFRGSKYVQSRIGDTYKTTKEFLTLGRKVLFSGTPCQIAGLRAFLQKDYYNLLTVDLVCHGVPSPLVWKKYLSEILTRITATTNTQRLSPGKKIINAIKFRDKISGWKKSSFAIIFEDDIFIQNDIDSSSSNFCNKINKWKQSNFVLEDSISLHGKKVFSLIEVIHKNVFFKAFYLNMRLSCYNCPVRFLKSNSDITIGDYWGIQNVLPDFDDNKGINLVMVNSEKGKRTYELLSKKSDIETSYVSALAGNFNIEKSVLLPARRKVLFKRYLDEPIIPLLNKLTQISPLKKAIKVILCRFGLLSVLRTLLK